MARVHAIAEAIGGGRVLKLGRVTPDALRREVETGLPYRGLEVLQERLGLTREEIATAIRVAPRTLARRKREGKLSADESDHLVRLAHVASEAERILGARDRAVGWLREPNYALGGEVPLRLVSTELGARQVEEILAHIEYGLVS